MQKNGYPNPMYLVRKGDSGKRLTHSMTMAASPMIDEWEIPVNKVIIETKFGEGCFGEVHKGFVRGPIHNSPTMKGSICIAVAIKMLKSKWHILKVIYVVIF